jgi:hypothetical protein
MSAPGLVFTQGGGDGCPYRSRGSSGRAIPAPASGSPYEKRLGRTTYVITRIFFHFACLYFLCSRSVPVLSIDRSTLWRGGFKAGMHRLSSFR